MLRTTKNNCKKYYGCYYLQWFKFKEGLDSEKCLVNTIIFYTQLKDLTNFNLSIVKPLLYEKSENQVNMIQKCFYFYT